MLSSHILSTAFRLYMSVWAKNADVIVLGMPRSLHRQTSGNYYIYTLELGLFLRLCIPFQVDIQETWVGNI